MQTVKGITQTSFREKGSKFIGYLFSAASIREFELKLEEIKSKYPDATHHCYAWRINPNDLKEFSQDDGEPSGTAGPPILNKLKSYEVVNSACVVVRYYGGTNLGKSGLIQAYGQAAEECLQQAELATLVPTQKFRLTYPYNQQKQIDRLKNTFDLKEVEADYQEKVTIILACRASQNSVFEESLQKLEHLGVEVKKHEAGYLILD